MKNVKFIFNILIILFNNRQSQTDSHKYLRFRHNRGGGGDCKFTDNKQ